GASRHGRARSPWSCCAIPTTPRSLRPASWGSRRTASGSVSSTRPSRGSRTRKRSLPLVPAQPAEPGREPRHESRTPHGRGARDQALRLCTAPELGEAFPDEALERVFVHAHDTDLPPGTFRTGRGPGRTAFSWGVSTRSKRSANVRRTTATTASTTAGRSNGTAILTRHVLPGLRVTQGATTAPTSRWIASVSSI